MVKSALYGLGICYIINCTNDTGGRKLKVIVVASGKGGTGKTSFIAGTASALAISGHKVLMIDGDIGLRNLDIALGMSDQLVFSFADVAKGMIPLERAAACHRQIPGLWLLTAPVTSEGVTKIGLQNIVQQAAALGFAYIFVDCPAGIGEGFTEFSSIATHGVIVSTPERAGLRGAERTARMMEKLGVSNLRLVLNRVRKRLIFRGMVSNLDVAMDETGLPLLGVIPEDEDVIACFNSGISIIGRKKDGASWAFRNIAGRLEGNQVALMKL